MSQPTAASAAIRVVDVTGSHREIGRQHGRAVQSLAPLIRAAAERHQAEVPLDPATRAAHLADLRAALERHSPATLEQIAGLAEGLDLDPDVLFGAATASYLHDLARGAPPRGAHEGCTTWAAGGALTGDGAPLLVKNRDYRLDHLPLQIVLRVRPERGIPWCAVTSAGAPGVYSSGMNAAGLAIADTHVPSRDAGPGLPRYSLMLHVLEEHATVDAALAYLAAIPMMGTGNLVLADATGTVAVVECGYRTRALVRREGDAVVATNHFVSPALADAYVEAGPGAAANSRGRYAAVQAALAEAAGRIDAAFARALMARHDGPTGSICQHRTGERASETISCTIFRPAERLLEICHGLPCASTYQTIPVVAP
ncbi:MAG: C45 family autoproteolytic acyltransferase/hydrolase [Sphaerobacter sp.]|nr:C45 family autoproteolytic acyltransferase/hydrolase [Sphaerobacter sp.]